MSRPSLNELLEQDESERDHPMGEPIDEEMSESVPTLNPENFIAEAAEGMCIECVDQEADIHCEQCLYVHYIALALQYSASLQ